MDTTILCQDAINISRILAEKLQDTSHIEYILNLEHNKSCSRGEQRWNMGSLADGLPGIIMLFAEWNKIDPHSAWEECIHANILHLHKNSSILSQNIGLFTGTTGIAYALRIFAENTGNYSTLLRQLDNHIIQNLKYMIKRIDFQIEVGNNSFMIQCDTIQGLGGIGRYVLEAFSSEDEYEILLLLISKITTFINDYLLPFYQKNESENYTLLLGMAHGICGILSFLISAYEKSICLPGQIEAIRSLTESIILQVKKDSHGIYVPESVVSLAVESYTEQNPARSIEGWCHGSLGMAIPLLRAGICLNHKTSMSTALELARAVYQFEDSELSYFPPTFCHGLAGLLHLSNSIYHICGDQGSRDFALKVADKLVMSYEENVPYGYKDWDMGRKIDNVGMLQGSSGIALSLLDFARPDDQLSLNKWNECFLIR